VLKRLFSFDGARFLVTGGSSTLLDYILYMLLSLRLPISGAKAMSMLAASLFSYVVNKRWTFQVQDGKNGLYLMKYYIAQAANFAVNIGTNALVYGLLERKTPAFVAATLCGMTVNYLMQKYFVFRKSKPEGSGEEGEV